MATYKSDIKTISSSEEVVFNALSNLESLAKLQNSDEIEEYVQIIDVQPDSCVLEVKQFGRIGLMIEDKTPYDSIQFAFTELPVAVQAEIKLDKINVESTAIQFVVNAELPKMLQMMFDKKLRKGVDVLSDVFEKVLNKNI